MLRKEIIESNGYYTIHIYYDNELLIVQDVNPQTGQRITTPEEAESIANELLNEFQVASQTVLEQKYEELTKLTYQYIIERYPDEKQKSDVADREFWSTFLVAKNKNYTLEDITTKIYDIVARVLEGQSTLQDELATIPNNSYTFGIQPFDKQFIEYGYDATNGYQLADKDLVPGSITGILNYGGNQLEVADDGQGNLVRTDTNEIIGTVNYKDGRITLDTAVFDIALINSLEVKYKVFFIIPEVMVWQELLKVALRVSFVQNVKFRYKLIKSMLAQMTDMELMNLDLQEYILQYYPDMPQI